MAQHAANGKRFLAESKYTEAVDSFTRALTTSASSPDYLIQRATAYQRMKEYAKALVDAEAAVVYAQQRAKRELIVQAQLRRGMALFCLERYGDAKYVLDLVQKMDPKEKSVPIWLSKTATKLAGLAPGDEKAQVTVPDMPVFKQPEIEMPVSEKHEAEAPSKSTVPSNSTMSNAVQPTPQGKVRHEWYESSTSIVFSLLAKGVPKEDAVVEINPTSLTISWPIEATGSLFEFSLDPLHGTVVPEKSSYKVLGTKIEVTLAKETVNQKWGALERAASDSTAPNQSEIAAPVTTQAPAYPTSAKGGAKNWDKIVSENSKPGEDDDDVGGDDASKFFKQLYKNASVETQRAMMKSYVESNGTALSTDWGEVSKGKVETVPPDGMVQKKWEK